MFTLSAFEALILAAIRIANRPGPPREKRPSHHDEPEKA